MTEETASTLVGLLRKISEERRGVKPKFTSADVYLTLYYIYSNGPLGRLKIASILGLGEASIKTMIRRLKEQGIVETDVAAGVYLTSKGEKLVRKLIETIPPPMKIDLKEIATWSNAYTSKISLGLNIIENINALNIRDELVRYGAEAALIIAYKEKPVLMGVEEYYHRELEEIASKLRARRGDIIIVAWSTNPKNALRALLEELFDIILRYKV